MNGLTGREGEVRLERTIRASADELFDAWTNAEFLKRWWHAERDWETPSAEVDPRLGGSLRILMRNPADGADYGGVGEFTIFEPPRRLAFTWTWDDDKLARRQLIEVEFIEQGPEQTLLVVTNRGLPKEETGDYLEGWMASLDNLEDALASR
jgi:uncharacterized protein YndB with AHSA1/START domain